MNKKRLTMKNLAPLLALLPLANALPSQRIPDILDRIKQQKDGGLQLTAGQKDASKGEGEGDEEYSDVETLYFDQRLDHFSQEDDKVGEHDTFRQRYFYTSRFVQQQSVDATNNEDKKVLAFLCVGGEGPALDTSVLVNSVHCTGDMIGLADKLSREHGYDVHLFALEHRYYGESFPPQNQNENRAGYLRGEDSEDGEEDEEFVVDYTYLSSRQAVKDIAGFVQSPEALTRLGSDNNKEVQWITFGGSYPGMLSAWSHLLHPDAIFAAVSSSAPVQAKLDFTAYNEHVGKDLEDEDVGGSKECRRIVEQGHWEVAAVLEGKDTDSGKMFLDHVATLFNVCDGGDALRASRQNQEVFVGDGLIQIPAQSNDPSCDGELCNIKGLCEAIITESKARKSAMEVLAHISSLQSKASSCNNVEWQSYVDWYTTPTVQNANDRSWLYQTCNEFGYYQTCNKDSTCPYGKGFHDVSRDLELCKSAFGIAPETVRKNIDDTLSYYGGWSLKPNTEGQKVGPGKDSSMLENEAQAYDGQKRIMFIAGDVDPWTELSYTKSGSEDHPSISVQGASHHFWTHEVKDSDTEFIVSARQTIYDTVSDWLQVEPIANWKTSVAVDTM